MADFLWLAVQQKLKIIRRERIDMLAVRAGNDCVDLHEVRRNMNTEILVFASPLRNAQ